MAVCDVCNSNVMEGSGYLLTTRQVVSTSAYWKHSFDNQWSYYFAIDPEGGSLASMVREQVGQDSPWLICDGCIELFRVNRAEAATHSRKWWSSGRTWTQPGCGPGSLGPALEAASEGWRQAFGKVPSALTDNLPRSAGPHTRDRLTDDATRDKPGFLKTAEELVDARTQAGQAAEVETVAAPAATAVRMRPERKLLTWKWIRVITCSVCGSPIRQLEGLFGGQVVTFGMDPSALDQWFGNVCVNCRKVYCGDCIELGGPTPCPTCGEGTLPAQRMHLQQIGLLPSASEDSVAPVEKGVERDTSAGNIRGTASTSQADKAGENPICPQCGTEYNRVEVIRQIRANSPEMFDFAFWTTKFKCVECGALIVISGHAR